MLGSGHTEMLSTLFHPRQPSPLPEEGRKEADEGEEEAAEANKNGEEAPIAHTEEL